MSATVKAAPPPKGLSAAASAFLEARGLDPDLCERLGLTSGPDRSGRDWIAIPYERNGVRVNRKFRAVDAKEFRQEKGGEQIFWRMDCLADEGLAEQPLLITEGEFDAIAAIQAGYWRTVSIPGGGNATPQEGEPRASGKYACIEAARALIEPLRHIIIATDGDAVGTATLTDLTALLGPARCQFVTYPPGCKDLNDVLLRDGVEGVKACIKGAKWVRVAGVHKLFDLPPLPPLETWRPNIHKPIDELLPICPGHLSVWTGIPGYGKSSLLNAIAWSISVRDSLRIAHGTFEATPQREYLDDAIGFLTGTPAPHATDEERERVRNWVQERITFIVSDGYSKPGGVEEFFDADLEWFFEGARTAVVRDGCRIVILDPWSQIEHARANSEPETTYIQRSIRRAKSFARTFDVHVAIVAHPTKQRKLDDGSYAMPEGYEISGSAHWFNGVDLGVTVHRAPPLILDDSGENWMPDPRSTRVLIRAWKKKNHRMMGKPGDAYASFDCNTGRYSSAEHWEERTMPKRYSEPSQRGEE
ncbi:MAG: hypothetical protein BroJett013_07070 [Alphaproteobacteria bacterium]|nr:MAG: hypothetical protein BroJett013_07070 [Alphaproteobacteria bacterium]